LHIVLKKSGRFVCTRGPIFLQDFAVVEANPHKDFWVVPNSVDYFGFGAEDGVVRYNQVEPVPNACLG
jgi:hypothetical protein